MSPSIYVWIAIGSALGGVARYWASSWAAGRFGNGFPWDTLLVNVTGSFLIGFFASLTGPEGRVEVSPAARHFFMVGLCGGYTTFSAFSLQTLDLVREGELLRSGWNILLSVSLCLVAVGLGHAAASCFQEGE